MTPDCTLVIRTPAELIAALPFVLGYHPHLSLAVVSLVGSRIDFVLCHELPPPGLPEDEAEEVAAEVAEMLARQDPVRAVVIGYGPPARADRWLRRGAEAVNRRGVPVVEVMRVHEGRWWSLGCDDARCCDPAGTPCLPGDSVIAAQATFQGRVALPSRDHLVARVAAVDGDERTEMSRATERGRRRFTELIAQDGERFGERIRDQGQLAVVEAERRFASGGTLSPDEAAWLGVLLAHGAVEHFACTRIIDGQESQIRLWLDMTRRVEPIYVPPAASLLGFAAWRAGDGALARVAVDRALAVDPEHELAELMHRILGFAVSPHLVPDLHEAL